MSRNAAAAAVLSALTACLLLGACGMRIPGLTPYKMEIQQGNYVTQEMTSALKTGMSKEQVRQTLGTPLLTDAFHGERWDYVYYREDEAGRFDKRRLVVFFVDGKLARVDGDIATGMGPPQ